MNEVLLPPVGKLSNYRKSLERKVGFLNEWKVTMNVIVLSKPWNLCLISQSLHTWRYYNLVVTRSVLSNLKSYNVDYSCIYALGREKFIFSIAPVAFIYLLFLNFLFKKLNMSWLLITENLENSKKQEDYKSHRGITRV